MMTVVGFFGRVEVVDIVVLQFGIECLIEVATRRCMEPNT